jgi:hypothetical protein
MFQVKTFWGLPNIWKKSFTTISQPRKSIYPGMKRKGVASIQTMYSSSTHKYLQIRWLQFLGVKELGPLWSPVVVFRRIKHAK